MEELALGANEHKSMLPKIYYKQNYLIFEGNSQPLFADIALAPLFEKIDEIINNYISIVIDFKLGYFNTASSLVIHKIFQILNTNAHRCKPMINYYVHPSDDKMIENLEIQKELNPKIQFNPIYEDI